ncbi:MAG: putative metal-binding motif-containing protein [Kofleriaceae bacterium]|nr:putative metal-binding motif-containing protein [Kofleriaceae bacterium]
MKLLALLICGLLALGCDGAVTADTPDAAPDAATDAAPDAAADAAPDAPIVPGPRDVDGDGYTMLVDCDDDSAAVHPDAPETMNGDDEDCDDVIDEGTSAFDDDGDGHAEEAGDCDDTRNDTHPGAGEYSNAHDEDCDGIIDEGTAYDDDDGDGSGLHDCDDTRPDVHPQADESCNGRDDDCDGLIDEVDAVGCTTHYIDLDGDSFGSLASCVCEPTWPFLATSGGDCDEGSTNARPGQTSYFVTPRTAGSYDYDCDGTETKQLLLKAVCAPSIFIPGWVGEVPACGTEGSWATQRILSPSGCTLTAFVTREQNCR